MVVAAFFALRAPLVDSDVIASMPVQSALLAARAMRESHA